MVGFGLRLKNLRQHNHFTQAQLAERLGLTTSVISAYETDIRMPSYDVLISLARIFKVSTDYLLGLEATSDAINTTGLTDDELLAIKHLIEVMKK